MTEQKFIISITKEELGEMPVTSYPGAITLVDTPTKAHEALRILSAQKMVGFDTETKPSFRKGCRHKVALMQISTGECCYLFRLNKLGICAELKNFLENPEILKIGLSVHDDFNAIRRTEDFDPRGFVDLQDMMRDFDISDISLQKIYAIIFGERISKGQRLTNWEADSLTPAQQAYAALDAWACLKLYRYLTDERFDPLTSRYRHLAPPPMPKAEKADGQAKETTAQKEAPKPKAPKAQGNGTSKSARRRLRRKKAKAAARAAAEADAQMIKAFCTDTPPTIE